MEHVTKVGEICSINTALASVAVLLGSHFFLGWLRKLFKKRTLATKRKEKRDACRQALKQLREQIKEKGVNSLKLYTLRVIYIYTFWLP